MTREELKTNGLTDEQIEAIMALYGQGIAAEKKRADDAEAQLKQMTTDLETARKSNADAADLRAQLDKANANYTGLRKANAIRDALAEYKPKDASVLARLLDNDKIMFDDAHGTITGLKEQIEPLKANNGYLFADTPNPNGGTPGAGAPNNGDFDMNKILRGE